MSRSLSSLAEAVQQAGAAGADQVVLAAAAALVRRVPRRVAAAGAVAEAAGAACACASNVVARPGNERAASAARVRRDIMGKRPALHRGVVPALPDSVPRANRLPESGVRDRRDHVGGAQHLRLAVAAVEARLDAAPVPVPRMRSACRTRWWAVPGGPGTGTSPCGCPGRAAVALFDDLLRDGGALRRAARRPAFRCPPFKQRRLTSLLVATVVPRLRLVLLNAPPASDRSCLRVDLRV